MVKQNRRNLNGQEGKVRKEIWLTLNIEKIQRIYGTDEIENVCALCYRMRWKFGS